MNEKQCVLRGNSQGKLQVVGEAVVNKMLNKKGRVAMIKLQSIFGAESLKTKGKLEGEEKQ